MSHLETNLNSVIPLSEESPESEAEVLHGRDPYEPPASELVVENFSEASTDSAQSTPRFASRLRRLGGRVLDDIIASVVAIPLMFLVLPTEFWVRAQEGSVTLLELVTGVGLSLVVFVILNGYLLIKRGQTIGKMAVGAQIVDAKKGRILPIWKVVGLRYLPVYVLTMTPGIGTSILYFINALFIFQRNRRCVHDYIAGTVVIDYTPTTFEASSIGKDFVKSIAEPLPEDSESRAMRMTMPVGRSGWAVASGYLALFSILFVPAPFALLTGILGIRDIRRNPKKHGMGRALFGIIMGVIFTVWLCLLLLGLVPFPLD